MRVSQATESTKRGVQRVMMISSSSRGPFTGLGLSPLRPAPTGELRRCACLIGDPQPSHRSVAATRSPHSAHYLSIRWLNVFPPLPPHSASYSAPKISAAALDHKARPPSRAAVRPPTTDKLAAPPGQVSRAAFRREGSTSMGASNPPLLVASGETGGFPPEGPRILGPDRWEGH